MRGRSKHNYICVMNYTETIEYMYDHLPMYSRIGSSAIKDGFSNILVLCNLLQSPLHSQRFIHIAGTNGKGSVSHMLASVLQAAGYKTGLYTSPHLKDFRERIKINGIMITEAEVVDFIEKIKPEIEQIRPSYFEITVAMAFDHFQKHQIDFAIIETGLGGRLDSTNIILPILSVITNIGLDHVQFLGDSIAKIAFEKAGIIKPATPIVIGERHVESESVFLSKAKEVNAPICFAEDHFQIEDWHYEGEMLLVTVSEKEKTDHKTYHLDLAGQYQTKNLLTVLESVHQLKLKGIEIGEDCVVRGLKQAKKQTGLHGRWETIQHHPRIVLDVAHNENGIKELQNQLETTSYHRLHIVLGMVKDKDIDSVLDLLPKTAIYYFTNAHIQRALPSEVLKEKAATVGLQGNTFENVNTALETAKYHAHKDDLILVCGSIFLVGEVQ